eukprot:gnl/Chilomastix_caulleri/166.p1 GENE.gnl/Chilomastix_caulleri/166~~gnl/Chilomastix_caulleri/166.p1  ORF type:complete len:334 (-),score=140.20 gnl/Chilomastix_caulleri/166:88-1035(-)
MIALVLIAAAFSSLQGDWEKFKIRYGKTYSTEEDEIRFGNFIDNIHFAELMNKLDKSATYGVTAFFDLTSEEFSQKHLGFVPNNLQALPECEAPTSAQLAGVPENFDWVQKGVVSPVQDQGSCGSCWAFATVAASETAWAISHGELIKLSEQQLVDCDSANGGCDGGNMVPAEKYVEEHGLCKASDYPYRALGGKCKTCTVAVKTSGHCVVRHGATTLDTENNMKYDCATYGPIVIGINANKLQLYKNGIMDASLCNPNGTNHAVVGVGYGVENGMKFWKIRNSWGSTWGEQGYFRIVFGENACGVASSPSFVLA